METDLSILDESQELFAKDPAKVQSPIQNANEGNLKTTGLTQLELSDDLSLDSNDVFRASRFCMHTYKKDQSDSQKRVRR